MKIKMTLLSDAIFGNGVSTPGEEDISVQYDAEGFPYYRGSTFKGVFREELVRYLGYKSKTQEETDRIVDEMLGKSGNAVTQNQVVFSDFTISEWIKEIVLEETEENSVSDVRDALTNVRTFTAMDEGGMVKQGSLRMARCVNKGLVLYSTVDVARKEQEETVKEVLGMIKWIGTMRNRGFGKVLIEEV